MQQSLPILSVANPGFCSASRKEHSSFYISDALIPSCLQVCTPALNILEDMGVLKELVDHNEAHFADSGGFVSPSGLAYIGESSKVSPSEESS